MGVEDGWEWSEIEEEEGEETVAGLAKKLKHEEWLVIGGDLYGVCWTKFLLSMGQHMAPHIWGKSGKNFSHSC